MSTDSKAEVPQHGPLSGYRVLELGQLIAGPFTGTILGYFGAEVIKVEPPQGDPLRVWRALDDDGTSYWWRSAGRNKKSVTLDLTMPEAREVVKDLATNCDVIIENFRPGKMESWNLGPEDIRATNPDIIYTRISGYGQDGPYSPRPGYASVCEAVGGLRHINGFEGMPPVRPNISLGDSLAGLHAALGVVMSLLNRDGPKGTGKGQIVDVAIYEAMFNMMESIVPEFDGAQMIRGPSGSTITGITPTNTYVTKEGAYVVIGGNGDSIYKRLMTECGRPDMANDPMLSNNALRNKQEKEIDEAIQAYTSLHTSEHILERMRICGVPAGPVYSVQDMFEDPHFIARGMLEQVHIAQTGKDLKIPAIVPKLTETPGGTRFPGAELGSYTDEVLAEVAGFSAEKIADLREKGALAVRRPRTN